MSIFVTNLLKLMSITVKQRQMPHNYLLNMTILKATLKLTKKILRFYTSLNERFKRLMT